MAGELATRGPISTNIEQVLIGGDLAQLKPDERLNYYNTLCNSLGLNPLTQPFQYIVLNGKLQLYAKKDCTEQLRKIHGVSITSVDPKQIGDLLVVVASASDREGRVDSSTGAVNLSGLKGETLANAMMKAETKAKRRVTLSLCGLGMLDETEVQTLKEQGAAQEPAGNKWEGAETVIMRDDGKVITGGVDVEPSVISHSEPEIRPKSQKANPTQVPSTSGETPTSATSANQSSSGSGTASSARSEAVQGEVQAEPSITQPQAKRFFAIMRSANLSDDEVKARLAKLGYHGSRDMMPKRIYEAAVDAIDPEMKFHTNKPKE